MGKPLVIENQNEEFKENLLHFAQAEHTAERDERGRGGEFARSTAASIQLKFGILSSQTREAQKRHHPPETHGPENTGPQVISRNSKSLVQMPCPFLISQTYWYL